SYSRSPTPGKNFAFLGPFEVTYRQQEIATGEKVKKYLNAGQNPPAGAIIHYFLKEQPQSEVTLSFLDVSGKLIRTFSSEEKKVQPRPGSDQSKEKEKEKGQKEPRVPKAAGANRFVWDMHYPYTTGIEGDSGSEKIMQGALVPPGTYQVQLKLGDQSYTQAFEVLKDPRITASQEDLQQQFELLQAIRARISEVHATINTVRSLRRQANEWEQRTAGHDLHESLVILGKTLKDRLLPIEEGLIQLKVKDQMDTLSEPMQLSGKLAALAGTVASADAPPTRQARLLFDDLSARVATRTRQLREIIDTDVAAFNSRVREAHLPAIMSPIIGSQRE
ncbi:MAG: glycosyl hydrolase, partial [Candidatus Dormibacteraceae bacterium]